MPSDQNPWNIGGNGIRRPPAPPPPPPNNGGPWGGGQIPPELRQILAALRAVWTRLTGGHASGPGTRGAMLSLIIAAALWLGGGFYRVQPDEQGLVMRFGAYSRSTLPGLNFHLPWPIEDVILEPVTRIKRVEIGFTSDAADDGDPAQDANGDATPSAAEHDLSQESLMLTGDENIVDINASVFWRIRDAATYAFNTRNPDATVKDAAESVLRQVVGRTDIQSALTEGRAAIEQAVTTGTQAILDQYGTGVEITQVQLQKVDPPPEVIESFRDVQRANTDADRARNEAQSYANDIVPRAQGDAAALVLQAEGARDAAIATATGEATRFNSVYAAYLQSKDITLKRLYIETMEDVLSHAPTTVVDDRLRGVLPVLKLGGSADTSVTDLGVSK